MKTPLVILGLWLALLSQVRAGEPEVRSLTLSEALHELDAQSPTLAQVRSRVAEAEALANQADVPLLPTLVAAGGYTRNSDDASVNLGALRPVLASVDPAAANSLPGAMVIQPLDVWSVSGSARVPLVMPSAWADRKAARLGADGVAATAEATRASLRATLAQAAWAAATAKEVVAASERAVTTAEEHRASAARGVEAGTGAPLSVLKADTEVVRRRSDLARARAELQRSRLALGVLLGRSEPVRVQPPANAPLVEAPELLVTQALGQRPELKARAADVHAAQAQVSSARLRWAPQLSSSASVFAADEPYPTNNRWGWRVSLDASWALFDGGLRAGKRQQAEASAAAARAAAEAQRLAVLQEVEDALRDLSVTEERLRLAEQQHAFASAAAASAQRTFAAGVASSLDVLDANDRLYQADVAVADARGHLGMARVALDKALGRTP
jgi:outer membrane protein TolC